MYVTFADTNTILQRVTLTTASLRALHSKNFLQTGSALFAEWERISSLL